MRRKQREGFALIEVLAMIFMAMIAGALLVVVYSCASSRSRVAATRADISAIQAACEEFRKDMGVYPPDQHCDGGDMAPGTAKPILGAIMPEPAYRVAGDSARIVRDPENGTTKGLVHLLGGSFSIQGKRYGPYIRFKLNRLKAPPPSDPAPRKFSDGSPVLIMADWFGNAYVYDCHLPEGRRILPKPHNSASFDIYSFGPICPRGPDGLIADENPDNPGGNEDDINDWAGVLAR